MLQNLMSKLGMDLRSLSCLPSIQSVGLISLFHLMTVILAKDQTGNFLCCEVEIDLVSFYSQVFVERKVGFLRNS